MTRTYHDAQPARRIDPKLPDDPPPTPDDLVRSLNAQLDVARAEAAELRRRNDALRLENDRLEREVRRACRSKGGRR